MCALSVHVIELAGPGEDVAEQLAAAGHTVSGPESSSDLPASLRDTSGVDVVVVVGGCGAREAFPAALHTLNARPIPGFGERARRLADDVLAMGAIGLCAEAALVGDCLVFGVPEHPGLAQQVVAQVLLPALPSLTSVGDLGVSSAASTPSPPDVSPTSRPAEPLAAAAVPTKGLSIGLSQPELATAPEAEETAPASRGWLAAVQALKGELHIGRREELPEPIEKLAPVVNVLHTAGEFGTLRLPSGRRYGVYGWPDLRRPGSKVLAVSWGDPLAEIVVLHRHPHPVGTSIEGDLGLLPSTSTDLADACERATGSVPPNTSGRLFAMDGDTVWINRERRVFKWDGNRERDDGSPKQVLASLTLRWSNH